MWIRGRLCRIEPEIAGPDRTVGCYSAYVESAEIEPLDWHTQLAMTVTGCSDPRGIGALDDLAESLTDSDWREIDRAFWDAHPAYDLWHPVYANADGNAAWRRENGIEY